MLALDRLEPLVSEARKHHGEGGLLPADFGEKAAKMIMDGDEKAVQQESEQEESVEQRADRYFADLWTLSS